MTTEFIHTDEINDEVLTRAGAIIRRGGLVVFPTETVYGLGANAHDAEAAKKVYAAKGRPSDNPLITHIATPEDADKYAVTNETYRRLARAFMPGPLTVILPKRDCIPLATTGGLDSVGIRCPENKIARRLIAAAGVPIAAPSANLSGKPSPTRAAHVRYDLDGKVDMILDGGDCTVGVESTIVKVDGGRLTLLRPGGITLDMLRALFDDVSVAEAVTGKLPEGVRPLSPGMKYRHYAPKAPVTVVTGDPAASAQYIQTHLPEGAGVICFTEFKALFPGRSIHDLGPAADKAEQARRVFDALREFDHEAVTEIYAQCPDTAGLGLAVANRLKKAAGFHVIEV